MAVSELRRHCPDINSGLAPVGYRNGSDPVVLPYQINNHPAALALLQMVELERAKFTPSQPGAQEHAQRRSIAFSFQGVGIRKSKQVLDLMK